MTSTPTFFDAVLFDLDGVLTATSALHAAAWKETFDSVLDEPFDIERDYLAHVDGKPRLDGVRDLLRSRGIEAGEPAVRAIAARKQALVERLLADNGVDAFAGSVRWVEQLRAAGIDGLFDLTFDGRDAERLGLRGKPAPDGFLAAAARLGVEPGPAIVVEDALAGVAAGRAGAFGLVIGVARGAAPDELLAAGADIVVGDLGELV